MHIAPQAGVDRRNQGRNLLTEKVDETIEVKLEKGKIVRVTMKCPFCMGAYSAVVLCKE